MKILTETRSGYQKTKIIQILCQID